MCGHTFLDGRQPNQPKCKQLRTSCDGIPIEILFVDKSNADKRIEEKLNAAKTRTCVWINEIQMKCCENFCFGCRFGRPSVPFTRRVYLAENFVQIRSNNKSCPVIVEIGTENTICSLKIDYAELKKFPIRISTFRLFSRVWEPVTKCYLEDS